MSLCQYVSVFVSHLPTSVFGSLWLLPTGGGLDPPPTSPRPDGYDGGTRSCDRPNLSPITVGRTICLVLRPGPRFKVSLVPGRLGIKVGGLDTLFCKDNEIWWTDHHEKRCRDLLIMSVNPQKFSFPRSSNTNFRTGVLIETPRDRGDLFL